MNKKPSQKQQGLRRERSGFEWVLLTVSLAAIAAVVFGLFRYSGDTSGDAASLTAEVEETGRMVDGGPEVLVTLTNEGDSGAVDVVVEVKIGVQTREISFLRIAKDEERTGAVVFGPESAGLPEASVVSYNYP